MNITYTQNGDYLSIPYPVARQDRTNNVKITATTGDTTATYKESFTH